MSLDTRTKGDVRAGGRRLETEGCGESAGSSTSASSLPPPDAASRLCRARIRRLLLVLVGLAVAVALFHQALLTCVGRFFVLDEADPRADCVLVLSGDGRLAAAAELFQRATVPEVWLVEQEPDYLVRDGIVRPAHVVARDHLLAAGIPEDAVVVLSGQSGDDGDTARLVLNEFRKTPGLRVIVLCDRFKCRNVRWAFDSVLPQAHSAQVALRGLPDAEFDETNWWRSRRGWKAVLMETTDLLHLTLMGISSSDPPEFDPDEYERRLRTIAAGLVCHEG